MGTAEIVISQPVEVGLVSAFLLFVVIGAILALRGRRR